MAETHTLHKLPKAHLDTLRPLAITGKESEFFSKALELGYDNPTQLHNELIALNAQNAQEGNLGEKINDWRKEQEKKAAEAAHRAHESQAWVSEQEQIRQKKISRI